LSISVAHVVRQYYPSVGGLEEVVQQIARYQIRRGQSPSVITLDRVFRQGGEKLPAKEVVDGVPVTRLPFKGSERYPICPGVLNVARTADLVHVHAIDFFFDYLALTKPFHGRPLIACTHGGFFHTDYARRAKKLYFNSVTRASAMAYSRIVANSANDGVMFKEIVPDHKLVVIENGVSIDKYEGRSSAVLKPTLIYFGRWSANKGLAETFQLLHCLLAIDPTWRLIVAGREYDHTVTELGVLIKRAGLERAIDLVPNPSQSELGRVIGQASYFICLSKHEGFGMAPIEAMGAGLTPVLSDIPPFRKLINESGHGILLSHNDTRINVDRLLALHKRGTADYLERREAVRRSAVPYGWGSAAEKYVQCYQSIVEERR
jgi:alpha-1,3-mannosyltransferase